jgi:zinc transporter ZupT
LLRFDATRYSRRGLFSLSSATSLSFLSAAIGTASALVGLVSLARAPQAAKRIVPFSGGLLVGIALFGVLPELADFFGWARSLALLAFGIGLLWLFGRYVYPVCPSCSHTHNHDQCLTVLHGFAPPLVIAGMLHSFLDGLGIAASQSENAAGLGRIVLLGVLLHKLPEGVALGVILRASLRSRASALGWCALIQSATVGGALLESLISPWGGANWVLYALALAGGSFLYLGFHAVHGEWRRRGPWVAFMPALTGAAGAAVLNQGLHFFLR